MTSKSRKDILKEKLDKVLKKNTKNGNTADKLINAERPYLVLKSKRGNILYSEDSFKRLLNNDTLKYEKNMKTVIDDFMNFSTKSYYFISNKLKNVKVQI